MTALSLPEWGRLMDAGAVTYTVGKVPGPYAPFADRAEAVTAADQALATLIRWDGRHGREITADEYDAEAAYLEPEAGL